MHTLAGYIRAAGTVLDVGSSGCGGPCCVRIHFLLRLRDVLLVANALVAEPVVDLDTQTKHIIIDQYYIKSQYAPYSTR